MRKNERGSVVVEAAYIFPIMIFVIVFLIYLGNAYFLQAAVDNLTNQAAERAASLCADPFLLNIEKEGAIPTEQDAELYRYIFSGYMKKVTDSIENELDETIGGAQQGFLEKMTTGDIGHKCTVNYNRNFIQPTVEVTVKYEITVPIRFVFSSEKTSVSLTSYTEVPVIDTAEFIQIFDMLEDYYASTGLQEKVNNAADGMKKSISDLGSQIKDVFNLSN